MVCREHAQWVSVPSSPKKMQLLILAIRRRRKIIFNITTECEISNFGYSFNRSISLRYVWRSSPGLRTHEMNSTNVCCNPTGVAVHRKGTISRRLQILTSWLNEATISTILAARTLMGIRAGARKNTSLRIACPRRQKELCERPCHPTQHALYLSKNCFLMNSIGTTEQQG